MESSPNSAVRVLAVLFGGAAVYVVLALLVYYLYFAVDDQVYDRRLQEGLGALQALFYLTFTVHILGTGVIVAALTKWLSAPAYPVMVLGVVLLIVAAALTIGMLSFLNACESGASFPVRGAEC